MYIHIHIPRTHLTFEGLTFHYMDISSKISCIWVLGIHINQVPTQKLDAEASKPDSCFPKFLSLCCFAKLRCRRPLLCVRPSSMRRTSTFAERGVREFRLKSWNKFLNVYNTPKWGPIFWKIWPIKMVNRSTPQKRGWSLGLTGGQSTTQTLLMFFTPPPPIHLH